MMHEELANEAWQAARDAMQHFADNRLYPFVREAARALELGGKASLAKIHPVLIADPKNIDSQMQLAGVSSKQLPRIRTISARDVLDRLKRIWPTLKSDALLEMIDVRDGSTHFLTGQHAAMEAMAMPFLQAIASIQADLGASDEDVFGAFADMVAQVRKEHSQRIERIVATKLARAKAEFARRYDHLSKRELEGVLAAIRGTIALDKYEEDVVACPACGFDAVVSGQVELDRWEPDYDVEGDESYISGAYPIVNLLATELSCRVCGLALDGDDELREAGIESVIPVEDPDPADFYNPEEYDEDRYGDRYDDG